MEWAPKFVETGTTVIDNSSAWRLSHALIVPEINGDTLTAADKIIANPNCSTIQLVMALKPLHDAFHIKRVVVSTYQSITGTGMKALQQLENEITGINGECAYQHPIYENVLPHCDVFEENGYTKEEMKLSRETKKILGDDSVLVSATAVRVPIKGGHSESVNIEFTKPFELSQVRQLLKETEGVVYKTILKKTNIRCLFWQLNKDEVFVGRIRRDFTQKNTLNMWIVSDNLRKGAATNAVQIAEKLIQKDLFKKASVKQEDVDNSYTDSGISNVKYRAEKNEVITTKNRNPVRKMTINKRKIKHINYMTLQKSSITPFH